MNPTLENSESVNHREFCLCVSLSVLPLDLTHLHTTNLELQGYFMEGKERKATKHCSSYN